MQVWALYAYGAANILQEILTVKSDDVVGRVKVYEALVKGNLIKQAGIPESFRVLIKEFQALGLDMTIINDKEEEMELRQLEEEESKAPSALSIEEIEDTNYQQEIDTELELEEVDNQNNDEETEEGGAE